MTMSVYPVTSRLIQKFVNERVHENFHVSCYIEFNLKKIITKRVHGNLVVPLTVMHFLAMVHGYVHVRNITVKYILKNTHLRNVTVK